MANGEPISLKLKGKIFIQFEGSELIEVVDVELPFVVGVVAPAEVEK